ATKLQNMRKIWGQDFDGTGNVTGALSSVTNIDNLLHFAGNNIGIGTNSPIYKLDVNGNMRISDELFVNSFLYLANNKGLCLKDKEGSNQRAVFISSSNTVYFGCNDRPLYTLFEGDELQFNVFNKGWQNALVISRDRTAIFTGNVLAQGGVTAYTTSDRRLKENIKQVDSMRIIRSLGGTWQFDYKDSGEHSIGLIAQSVKGSALGSMVYTNADGYMKLNYLDTRLIALALGAAVQVDDKVERLKKRIKVLEKEIEKLKGGEK
ncbi:tail fiber domain-containing protein, partial [Segatella oris]|uniref:tail fiber domain-containing protein n=1 Tax=Segatella oris TaxID=28135 RepID=UPI0028F0E168